MNSDSIRIAWYGLHSGEEPPLVGNKGAGTIFFTGCNLRCVYCQNYQISQQNIGRDYSQEEFKRMMLELQDRGALNIDLVTPTIWAERIRQPIVEAKKEGLRIPIVWNSNAYESVEMLKTFEGLIDIYLPDFKYGDDELGFKYSGIKNYSQKAKASIKEMLRQVGNLKLSQEGIAEKGVMIRHMILPNHVENSKKALDCIKEIDSNVHVNLMNQYEPVNKAAEFSEINRNVSQAEFDQVFAYLSDLGFENGWVQEMDSPKVLLPDFTKENPFA
jgi:putative pyruvate formate lyase activating enzyme